MKGSKLKIVSGQILDKAINLWPYQGQTDRGAVFQHEQGHQRWRRFAQGVAHGKRNKQFLAGIFPVTKSPDPNVFLRSKP